MAKISPALFFHTSAMEKEILKEIKGLCDAEGDGTVFTMKPK